MRGEVVAVVQGPWIDNQKISTERLVHSLSKCSVFDRIVVSTYWEDRARIPKSIDQLARIVCSEDPGSQCFDPHRGVSLNLNRQLTTTKAGLLLVDESRDTVLKLRSDLFLKKPSLMAQRIKSFQSSKMNLMCVETTTPNFMRPGSMFLYHFSDWVLGFKGPMIKKFLEIPLANERSFSDWAIEFESNGGDIKSRCNTHVYTKYSPEQWFTQHLTEGREILDHIFDYSDELCERYSRRVGEVFWATLASLGLRSQKYRFIHFPHIDRLDVSSKTQIGLTGKKVFGLIHKAAARLNDYF